MQVRIIVEAGSADDQSLTSLYHWLAQDPDVIRQAGLALVPERSGLGEMGGAFDVINAIVSNGIALGNLALACAMWRQSRPSAPAVRIERDGVTVTVEDGSPERVSRVVAALGWQRPQAGEDRTGQR
ncbi:effector-associated constant component EACC1 [Streptomyces sp. NPDC002758]